MSDSPPRTRKISAGTAIVYDFLQVVGGAELLSIELARRLPDAQLIVGGVASEFPAYLLPSNLTVLDARPLPRTPALRALHTMYTFNRANDVVKPFRNILLSGHYAPLLFRPSAQTWLYYAHTAPLPFLHEDRARTLDGASRFRQIAHDIVGRWLKVRIERILRSGVTVIANSHYTADAFRQRLRVEAEVAPPPCDLDRFRGRASKGYFLSFARQEPGKRVDRIIEAFRLRPTQHLVVASDGSEHERLCALASGADNIEFIRTMAPQAIQDLLADCRASIYIPSREPFGISAVESLASGKPVIASRCGGLQQIIEPQRTGWLLSEPPSISSIAATIDEATEAQCAAMYADCVCAGSRYDWATFLQTIKQKLG